MNHLDFSITAYCEERGTSPEDCVQEMRAKIFEETKLTASAGIAPNKVNPLLLQLRDTKVEGYGVVDACQSNQLSPSVLFLFNGPSRFVVTTTNPMVSSP
jgi:nucleotidyltransferase/DNA polymerase involved in DNA repair